jgi:hypothetical protein
MYCETAEEQECFKRLKEFYPAQHDYMLDLIAWVFTNKPERFDDIMAELREMGTDTMIDLENFDIKSIMKSKDLEQ